MKENVIDEQTPVPLRLGLIVLFVTTALGLAGGVLGGIWWWASWSSRIDTKLTSIESGLVAITQTNNRNGEKIDEVERRVTKLEVVGSPALQQMQKDIMDLMRQFEIHKAKEPKQ